MQAPSERSSFVGSAALGAAILLVFALRFAGAPRPVRSASLLAATAIAASQWATASSQRERQAAQISAIVRKAEVRSVTAAINIDLESQAQIERLEADGRVLRKIAQAPLPLQPMLLERTGFGWMVPQLMGTSATLTASADAARTPVGTMATPLAAPPSAGEYTPDTVEGDASRYEWIKALNSSPAVLIYGKQGSGKSTLAEYLVSLRLQAGHDVEVLDPHYCLGAWDGLPVHGVGMQYREIDERLQEIARLAESRYEKLATVKDYNPKPLTVVTEEITNWADRTQGAGGYLKASLSDNRKIKLFSLFIGHARTLDGIGGAKGLGKTRDEGLMELNLIPEADGDGVTVPSRWARLRYPGEKEPVVVEIPNLTGFKLEASRCG